MSSTKSSSKSSLAVEGYEEINDSGDAASDQGEPTRPKKSLAEIAQSEQRFIAGGSTKPAPLNYGPSLLDMLKEGPPEDCDQPLVTSPTVGSAPPTPTMGTPKKGRKLAKQSLSAVRRLITPKHKRAEPVPGAVETSGPSSPSHVPGTPGSDGHETATTTSPTSPTPLGKIYGQPPAYKIRPEHLRLSSFPPVPKEELAKLPRDLEPTLPSGQSHCTPIHCRTTHLTADMRTFEDTFSGEKIYPGKGKIYVRGDSKIFRFQNGKTESLFLQRKNPRRIAWTTLYRRQHKKGISEEVAKKRTRRTVKQQRGIVGASLEIIKERRSQRPEARAAARQEAIKAGKEKKSTAESKKKMEKAKSAAGAARGQVRGIIQSKQGAKGAPSKATGKVR
ncbi:MAG: hypothetical protein Q9208_003741 [Pyrenodesmia sp. 3 TL-2023]